MEKLKECIITVLGANVELQNNTNLIEDLGMNSLSMIDLIMEIESEFGISIPDEHLDFDEIIIFGNLYLLVLGLTRQ